MQCLEFLRIPPYADNIEAMIENWGKLLNTNCNIFLPGHGKEIKRELLQKEYYKYARKHNNVYKALSNK
jgi:glyoxylase-like metal-dependent hydrolase (beta-lactamase superfamily II)